MFATERIELWLKARATRVLGEELPKDVVPGPGYFYRPEQLIVNNADLELVADQLKRVKAEEHQGLTRQLLENDVPVTVFQVSTVPIPALVSRLRAVRAEGSPVPRVGPNHVLFGEPNYIGSPGGEPRRATAPVLSWDTTKVAGPTVSALDTGIPADLATLHPDLAQRVVSEGDDVDALYSSGDLLDHEAGHGTFVSGILMQLAPWLHIDPEKVLNSAGIGDDTTITLGLAKSKCLLANASLGGYTHDDMPPPALEAFLDKRDPESVIVAAAGNNKQSRPFWPAAFKHVVAVGAVDTRKGALTQAEFTNYGEWVDCCAPGVDVRSTYVDGEWRLAQSDIVEAFGGWAYWSGTSFATPHVTAAIAAKMNGTTLTARQAALMVLAESTTHIPGLGVFVAPLADLVN
jgi:subtilisin family serine protease